MTTQPHSPPEPAGTQACQWNDSFIGSQVLVTRSGCSQLAVTASRAPVVNRSSTLGVLS